MVDHHHPGKSQGFDESPRSLRAPIIDYIHPIPEGDGRPHDPLNIPTDSIAGDHDPDPDW
jgi:hypothetical protein